MFIRPSRHAGTARRPALVAALASAALATSFGAAVPASAPAASLTGARAARTATQPCAMGKPCRRRGWRCARSPHPGTRPIPIAIWSITIIYSRAMHYA